MLKKAREAAAVKAEATSGRRTAQAVLDSSHQIWLAGLGAFSARDRKAARCSRTLVKQGEELEQRTKQAAADTRPPRAARQRRRRWSRWRGGTWDKLEQVFEDRVARALGKLGVYTQNDVQRLAERVEALSAAVNELLKASGCERRRGARRAQDDEARRPATTSAKREARYSKRSKKAPTAGNKYELGRVLIAVELLDLLDVVLHRLVLARALELGPCVVFRAADEIETAGTLAL